jgi:hypothetical protein
VAGAAVALVGVAAAALAGAGADSWLAAATPIAAAMFAGATAGSILHWRKVCGRSAVHFAVVATALCVLLTAQILRVADMASLLRSAGIDALFRGATWSAAIDLPAPLGDARGLAGLEAVRAVFGVQGMWVFVVTELALVVGLAWWMAGRALAAPLCVACREWCVRQRGVVERAGDAAAPDLVRQRVTARDWRFFRDLGPARGGSSLRFDLARCPRCDRSNAVSVMWERPLWRDRCLIGDLRLGSDDLRTLLELVEPRPDGHWA